MHIVFCPNKTLFIRTKCVFVLITCVIVKMSFCQHAYTPFVYFDLRETERENGRLELELENVILHSRIVV